MKIFEIITEIDTANSVEDMENEILQDISHRGGQIHPYYRRLDTKKAAQLAYNFFIAGNISQNLAISKALNQMGFEDASAVMRNSDYYKDKVGGKDSDKDEPKSQRKQPSKDDLKTYSDKFRGNQYVSRGSVKLPSTLKDYLPTTNQGLGTLFKSSMKAGSNIAKAFDPSVAKKTSKLSK